MGAGDGSERKDWFTGKGRGGRRRRPELTFFVGKESPKTKDLGHEDANGDEELGHHPQGPPQVLRGQLPQVHGDNIGGETCRGREKNTIKKHASSGGDKPCLQIHYFFLSHHISWAETFSKRQE